jgi:hypothetical protein
VFTNAFVPFSLPVVKNIRIVNKRHREGAIKQRPREGGIGKRIWETRETFAGKIFPSGH